MEAIFTIVAKNYIPLANVLGDSIQLQHPNLPFFIVVADTADGLIDYSKQRYSVIASEEMSISNLTEMAFKYNVTEFCTALKPFAFKHLFKQGYKKVLYLDPDIYVFNSLNKIFESLDSSSMVLTPHFQTPELAYSGLFREGNILFAGIFNLGFCGLRASENGGKITEWWCAKLKDYCYADRTDGLHVDQKWADFIPTLFPDVHIERGLGYNVAVWNWHERKLNFHDNSYWVTNRITNGPEEPVTFYHYSNYKFKNASDYRQFVPVLSTKYRDIESISEFYADLLIREHISDQLSKLNYSFATFDNNVVIVQFHRRFYRQLLEEGTHTDNPFITGVPNSFYNRLKTKNLIGQSEGLDKLNEINFSGFDRKLKYLNLLAKLVKNIIGFNRYALLCKFLFRYVRPENQVFLVKSNTDPISFVNENRYINTEK